MHKVAILALNHVVPFDLSIPSEVFGRARLPDGKLAYDVRVYGTSRTLRAEAFDIRVKHLLEDLRSADTIIVPGITDVDSQLPESVSRKLRQAAKRGTRIASICSGAFVLAEAGLLDGHKATTHWLGAAELARRYPLIEVDANVLYVDSGKILTSAGAAAGFDLCLHMVRSDFGAGVAAEVARLSVMPLERAGGQSQFIVHALPSTEGASIEPLLNWLNKNSHKPLTLDQIAEHGAVSLRTLNRKFQEQTGTTPLQWLIHARVRKSQAYLESTSQPVEFIADKVGFGSATSLREHFRRVVGTSPQAYRRSFRSANL